MHHDPIGLIGLGLMEHAERLGLGDQDNSVILAVLRRR